MEAGTLKLVLKDSGVVKSLAICTIQTDVMKIKSSQNKLFPVADLTSCLFSCHLISVSDPKHGKDQEDEEETAEENREEGHAGSAAEVTETERKSQRTKKQQG